MDQYLLIQFLVGWTSIYQLFWCSPGVQGFDTLPCRNLGIMCYSSIFSVSAIVLVRPLSKRHLQGLRVANWRRRNPSGGAKRCLVKWWFYELLCIDVHRIDIKCNDEFGNIYIYTQCGYLYLFMRYISPSGTGTGTYWDTGYLDDYWWHLNNYILEVYPILLCQVLPGSSQFNDCCLVILHYYPLLYSWRGDSQN